MKRRESELFVPVREWLRKNGYEVHVEIFDADVVAVKDGKLTVVELKPHFTVKLFKQLHSRALWADFVIAATFRPKSGDADKAIKRGGMKYHGFGVLLVDGSAVRELMKPKPQPFMWHKRNAYRRKKLLGRAEAMDHELAGLPSCNALREQRLKREADHAR